MLVIANRRAGVNCSSLIVINAFSRVKFDTLLNCPAIALYLVDAISRYNVCVVLSFCHVVAPFIAHRIWQRRAMLCVDARSAVRPGDVVLCDDAEGKKRSILDLQRVSENVVPFCKF